LVFAERTFLIIDAFEHRLQLILTIRHSIF
jgi:hypothetical protein